MESSKILGILCRKCHQLIDMNEKNHKCLTITGHPRPRLRAQKTDYYKSIKKPKIDSFEQDLLKELREFRPVPVSVPPPPPVPVVYKEDEDLHYSKYLTSLMKKLPTKKKLTLQAEFIKRVIESLED